MISVIMMYPRTSDSQFNWDYFLNNHIPRIREIFKDLGLQRIDLHTGVASAMPGQPPPYMCICEIMLDNIEGFQRGFMQEGAWIMGDIHNYSTVQPLVQISNIVYEK